MEKWQHVGKGKEKIPLRICDIILPTAHVQTKQGYVSGFHLRLFSPALSLLSSLFSLSLEKWEEEERGGRTPGVWKFVPSQPWTQHHSSSGLRPGGCLSLFSLSRFPPSLRTPLSAHLSSATFITALLGSLPLGRCWKSQQGGIYQEDNDHKSSLQTIYITELFFFFKNKNSGVQLLQLRVSLKSSTSCRCLQMCTCSISQFLLLQGFTLFAPCVKNNALTLE